MDLMIGSETPTLRPARPVREPGPLTAGQRLVVAQAALKGPALCVVGGPASGKTSALVAAVAARVKEGISLSQLVVLSASRGQAQQLRARIVAALGTTQRGLQITTVHGWCLQLLHRFAETELGIPRYCAKSPSSSRSPTSPGAWWPPLSAQRSPPSCYAGCAVAVPTTRNDLVYSIACRAASA